MPSRFRHQLTRCGVSPCRCTNAATLSPLVRHADKICRASRAVHVTSASSPISALDLSPIASLLA